MRKLHSYTLQQASVVTSLYYVGKAVGYPMMAYISNIFKKRFTLILLGSLLAAFFSIMALYINNLPYLYVCMFIFLVGFLSAVGILIFSLAHDSVQSTHVGFAISIVNFVVMLSGVFIQSAIGMMLDLNSSGAFHNGIKYYSLHAYQISITIIPLSFLLCAAAFLVNRLKLVNLRVEQ